jgi:hypothetical protein
MFNPYSNHPPSSRTMFAATGMGLHTTSAAAGIVTFYAGRALFGLAVLTNDPSGGPGM